ncbi:anti-sigma factor antagonist [Actinokineospora iranica]|uniref:Anti-sigma factor antagonist n=1 Tax=Actinokineospora iranica TaxID=1271860 RepID=A0A1G6M8Y5_9PSEU|nr:anti-sigma factor antagonist [Actinokineospora iranica]SDC52052.1 anti-sigma-factor antagonist [Actinokineospora iranica]
MTESTLTTTTERHTDRVVVHAKGEVDIATAPVLAAALTAATGTVPTPSGVIADLTGVTFLGSAGLAVLIETHDNARARGVRTVIVVTPGTAAHRSPQITGLPDELTTAATASEALTHTPTRNGHPAR